jgi:hypothetical protein
MKATCDGWFRRRWVQLLVLLSGFTSSICAQALTISAGPVLTTSTNAPLAAALQLTTDDYSRVSVSVDDGQHTWRRDFYDYDTTHLVPLLGFKPDQTNVITVTVHDRFGQEAAAASPVIFTTGPKPAGFPPSTLLSSQPEKMEPGYTLFMLFNENTSQTWMTAVDNSGDLVWYNGRGIPSNFDLRQLENGDLFVPLRTNFIEVSLLGQIVHSWNVPSGLSIDIHEGVPTDHGTILYLNDASRVVTNFPTSATNSNAPPQTAAVQYEQVIELSTTNSAVLNDWSVIDLLDPLRINYLTFSSRTVLGWDWEHANAIIEDPRDNSIIVSMRHQDAVIKFSRATGQLRWILGPHANWKAPWQPYLFTPTGATFFWNYAQHAPMITPQGTLLIYDDGNFRASPFDASVPDAQNFSRAVEYDLNEDTMEVSQLWDYGRNNSERLYTDRVGNAEWLPQRGNVLITFGYTLYDNGVHPSPFSPLAVMTRIKEVTHEADPQVVFDLAFFDYTNRSAGYRGTGSYRSHRIPDLYPVVSASRGVADLIASVSDSGSRCQRGMIALLAEAIKSVGQNNLDAAIRQLRTFQFLIRAAQVQPDTAIEFFNRCQQIIDALHDGKSSYASERLTGIYPLFTPNHALADLINAVGDSNVRDESTLATCLTTALTSISEGDTDEALRELHLFQALIRNPALSPQLTTQFHNQSQRIIDAVGQSPYIGHRRLRADTTDGKLFVDFTGSRNRTYGVVASSDMMNWVRIGSATPGGSGKFKFEENYDPAFRYFRVVSP